MQEAINTGKFKWCFTDIDLGSAEDGLIAVAEEDNALQGIMKGDYYGYPIDEIRAVTNQMSLILGEPLCPEIVVLPATNGGSFEDYLAGLEQNKCYATNAVWFRYVL